MGRPSKPLDKDTLYTMYWEQNLSILEISSSLGVSYETIRKRMHSFEIPRRPSGPAKLGIDRAECDNGHILDESNRYVSLSGRVSCRKCTNDRSRQHYRENHQICLNKVRERTAKNPEKVSAKNRHTRLKRFGLTVEGYEQKAASQNWLCALCKQPETEVGRNGQTRALAVDHDHKTGINRGLLCRRCNCVLGMFDDNPELFEFALAYLSRYKGLQDAT